MGPFFQVVRKHAVGEQSTKANCEIGVATRNSVRPALSELNHVAQLLGSPNYKDGNLTEDTIIASLSFVEQGAPWPSYGKIYKSEYVFQDFRGSKKQDAGSKVVTEIECDRYDVHVPGKVAENKFISLYNFTSEHAMRDGHRVRLPHRAANFIDTPFTHTWDTEDDNPGFRWILRQYESIGVDDWTVANGSTGISWDFTEISDQKIWSLSDVQRDEPLEFCKYWFLPGLGGHEAYSHHQEVEKLTSRANYLQGSWVYQHLTHPNTAPDSGVGIAMWYCQKTTNGGNSLYSTVVYT